MFVDVSAQEFGHPADVASALAVDEQRAHRLDDEPEDRPRTDLMLGHEHAIHMGEQQNGVEVAQMVAQQKERRFGGGPLDLEPHPENPQHSPAPEPQHGVARFLNRYSESSAERNGDHMGRKTGKREQNRGSQPECGKQGSHVSK